MYGIVLIYTKGLVKANSLKKYRNLFFSISFFKLNNLKNDSLTLEGTYDTSPLELKTKLSTL